MNEELLKIMACPRCKGEISHQKAFLTCNKCGLAFPVLDKAVPDMLIEDAWPLPKARRAGFEHSLKL